MVVFCLHDRRGHWQAVFKEGLCLHNSDSEPCQDGCQLSLSPCPIEPSTGREMAALYSKAEADFVLEKGLPGSSGLNYRLCTWHLLGSASGKAGKLTSSWPRVRSPAIGSRGRVLPVSHILVGREWQERAGFMFCTQAIGDSGEKREPNMRLLRKPSAGRKG